MAHISGKEVADHNSRKSCWIVIHDKVWDVTDFLDEHPGGAGLILKCAGKDASESYDEIHAADLVVETLLPEHCLGIVDDISGLLRPQSPEKPGKAQAQPRYPPLNTIVSVADFERVAETYLSPAGWAYYSSGADDEVSIDDARQIFRKMQMRPRILRRVEPVDMSTTILGCSSSLPIYLSPTGQGNYAYRDAESAIASVSGKEGLLYCMPTTAAHEAVFKARSTPNQQLFFQLYARRDKELTQSLLRKMETLGAGAIFLTVDSPVLGKRERDDRIKAAQGDDTVSAMAGGVAKTASRGLLNPLLSWDDVEWIRSTTTLPVVIKGVQTVEDALLAHAYGADGVVLSNHGGRCQDTAQSPILTLLEIRRYAPQLLSGPVRDKFQVLLDGGVRRGTDVIKAIALGASAVGIGRPVLYSMCAGYGEDGLHRLIQILRAEIATNMALAGARNVDELLPGLVNSERAERLVSRRVKL